MTGKDATFNKLLRQDFRSFLSDIHVAPFLSIEHAHHATKYLHEREFYLHFTRSGMYGEDSRVAKKAGGKNGHCHRPLEGTAAASKPCYVRFVAC